MNEQITLGETASGTGATRPGGRSVSLPIREVTGTVGLVAGAGGSDTASVLVAALANRGRSVLVLDIDGSFSAVPTPFDTRSCHAGADADRQLETEPTDERARWVYRTDAPVVVDGRRTDEATLGALTSALFKRSAHDDRPVVTVVCGIGAVLPADGPTTELGRAIRRLITQGPDRGLGVCAVTDRPATVDTMVRNVAAWSVWHRLTQTADTSVVRRELGGERAQAVRDLADDEAFFETEWTAAIDRISVRRDRRERVPSGGHTAPRTAADDDDSVPATSNTRIRSDLEVFGDRLEELLATVEERLDPDRLAADVADALEPRLDSADIASDSSDRASASRSADGSSDTDGSAGGNGFAGFDLLDDGTPGEESDSGAESSASDGLAALAGVGGDEGETTTYNGMGDRAVSDGGLDIDGVAAEVAAFEDGAVAVETGAESSGGKPAVVVDIESTLETLDDEAKRMLQYYRSEGPVRPETAHSAATEQASRVPAYTRNRQLRRAGLIEHVGRGRYDYSLGKRIEAGLPADRDDEMAAVYARDLEQAALD